MPVLPESTERLLHQIDVLPGAEGLVLGGGTALSLRLGHRVSADLDFVSAAPRLPRRRMGTLVDTFRRKHRVVVVPNVGAEQDFLQSGLELADYQQDFSVDGVKVTFFVPDPANLREALTSDGGVAGLKKIKVLKLESLFLMKAVTLNTRITLRDLFDLFVLTRDHHFAIPDIFKAVERFGFSAETLKARLLHAARRADDPGVETSTGKTPTFEELKVYFAQAIDQIEQSEAARSSRRARRPRPRSK